jgi:hypothetical protein
MGGREKKLETEAAKEGAVTQAVKAAVEAKKSEA